MKSHSRGTAAAAIASSSAGAACLAVANAQYVGEALRVELAPSRGTVAAAIASSEQHKRSVAGPGEVLRGELKSRSRGTAAAAIASNRVHAGRPWQQGPRRVSEVLWLEAAQAAAHRRLRHRCEERASFAVQPNQRVHLVIFASNKLCVHGQSGHAQYLTGPSYCTSPPAQRCAAAAAASPPGDSARRRLRFPIWMWFRPAR